VSLVNWHEVVLESMLQPIRGYCGHVGIRIATISNNTSLEPLEINL